MFAKRIIIIFLLLLSTSVYADGMPEWICKDDGTMAPYVEEVTKKPAIKQSNYNKLKRKYDMAVRKYELEVRRYNSEVQYTGELKVRILALQMDLDKKDKELSTCLNKPPVVIKGDPVFVEKPPVIIEKEAPISNYIWMALVGLALGGILW